MPTFDCHAHVYERVRAVPGARYVPFAPAPLADWQAHQARHGLRGGVIVQVSFLGSDNSELLAALARLDRARFAGVAVVPLDVGEAELDALVAGGVRGVRWNLVRGRPVPRLDAPGTVAFLAKLRARGLHLEVHLEGPRLAPVLAPLTDVGVAVVVDHFGLPSEPDPASDPFVRAVDALTDRSALYAKFSAPYRTGFDIRPHAEALRSALPPAHVVWGSDWPHTQHEDEVRYGDTISFGGAQMPAQDAGAVRTLYGLADHASSQLPETAVHEIDTRA
jgi:predicted TIM-barrel fold metal-dependent hydrolase